MAYTTNLWLERFEIKKPDYDFVKRNHVNMLHDCFEPARYMRKGNMWVPKTSGEEVPQKNVARLMFIGDITCFEKQFEEAQAGDHYDFSYEFEKVKPLFAQSDLVVGNLETMIFPDAPYRTEKYVSEQNFHCNAPIEFVDAVRTAGIDLVTNANNHDLDTGAIGIGETIGHVERMGLIQTGTFNTEKKRYELIDVFGFKIAIVAFATEHNNKRVNLTEEGAEFLLNDYTKKNAKAIIDQARGDGAELVFVCIHWGKENVTVHNSEQTKIATELAELGYDCIIGSHPHVLQPFDYLDVGNKSVPVFYSMGNFLSHNTNNPKARSVIACIDLMRYGSNVTMMCSYIPIYTSKCVGEKKYVVVPIPHTSLDPRNVRRKEQISQVVGQEIEVNSAIEFRETIEEISELVPGKKFPKPNLQKAKKFPVNYDDGKFVYEVHEDHAALKLVSESCATSSYSVPANILGMPVKHLKAGAFSGNLNIKKMNFGSNLTKLAVRVCKGCTSLEGFQLGKNINEIGDEAFEGCTSLSAAVMKKNVRKIGSRAFANCDALRSVKIPANTTIIADDAFEGCKRAVFYCEQGSYAHEYACNHGFRVVVMKLD